MLIMLLMCMIDEACGLIDVGKLCMWHVYDDLVLFDLGYIWLAFGNCDVPDLYFYLFPFN